jgi:1-acyl-sn-glycerol-3-phosphate acyltransferase
MKKALARFILKLFGWKIKGEIPKEKKYVLAVAPHTSALDMILGKLHTWAKGYQPRIIVKKEFFYFPVGYILRAWGAVPIDRQNPKNLVEQIADEFDKNDEFILVITPEGTRKANPNWKTGFYRIAQSANVPIYMIYADFKKKEIGYLGRFEPTGNMEEDIRGIKEHYRGITAYHPERFEI